MDLKGFFFLRLHCLILSVFIISYFSNSVWWRAQQPPLIKDKSIHPGEQRGSPVASLVHILTDRLGLKHVMRACARKRACPFSLKRPETLTHFPGEWQLQDGGMEAPQSL